MKKGRLLKRRISKTRLKKQCDKLFSLYIRKRDKVCQYPGCNKVDTHCAHIFSRRNMNLRYYPDNALALCYYHHLHWAHKEPILFQELVRKRLGKSRYDKLRMKKNLIQKTDLGLVLTWLKTEAT